MNPEARGPYHYYPTTQELAAKARRKFLLNRNTRWHGQKDARK